jgi:hypothetical protein
MFLTIRPTQAVYIPSMELCRGFGSAGSLGIFERLHAMQGGVKMLGMCYILYMTNLTYYITSGAREEGVWS